MKMFNTFQSVAIFIVALISLNEAFIIDETESSFNNDTIENNENYIEQSDYLIDHLDDIIDEDNRNDREEDVHDHGGVGDDLNIEIDNTNDDNNNSNNPNNNNNNNEENMVGEPRKDYLVENPSSIELDVMESGPKTYYYALPSKNGKRGKKKGIKMTKLATKTIYKNGERIVLRKRTKHHHHHPIVFYKKKRIPGKYWHEAQRRLVTKHGGLDVLGDIVQLPNGKVVTKNFGQNIPNFNDGYLKPWELQVRLQQNQRRLIKMLLRKLLDMAIRKASAANKSSSSFIKEIHILS
ncbi:hypothetical protein NH340_JMT04720 [Sarcoptes scabiei]|nr:hypothetical protein NH340_JMT04720 [Sarcoptes scabiei]